MLWTGVNPRLASCSRQRLLPARSAQANTSAWQLAAPGARGLLVRTGSFWRVHEGGEELGEEHRRRRFTRRESRSKREAARGGQQQQPLQLEQQQEQQQTQVQTATACNDDLLELCVGGTVMMTSRSTLAQIPGSVLHDMFSCQENDRFLPRSSRGEIFLDFEPYMFALVLRFLRELKMGRGAVDHSLSSFRQEDRAHLLLMLRHLRLLPQPHQDSAAATTSVGAYQQQQQQHQHHQQIQQQQQQRHEGALSQASASAPRMQPQARSPGGSSSGCSEEQGKGARAAPQTLQHAHSQGRPTEGAAPPASRSSSGGGGTGSTGGASSSAISGNGSGSGGLGSLRPKPRVSGSGSAASVPGGAQEPVRLVAPPVPRPVSTSQLYYVQAQYEERRGIKISVYTEADLSSLSAAEQFGIFCDATASEGQLSFTFVCRQEFDDMFVGITTRNHTDCKGSQVPSFGWKRNGCIYSAVERSSEGQSCPLPAPGLPKGSRGAGEGGRRSQPLWRRGDSVELIVSMGDAISQPRMVLKVNGQQLDHIAYLPPLHSWSWYLALYMGTDTSSVAFTSDSYAVFWGQYQVKRFLS